MLGFLLPFLVQNQSEESPVYYVNIPFIHKRTLLNTFLVICYIQQCRKNTTNPWNRDKCWRWRMSKLKQGKSLNNKPIQTCDSYIYISLQTEYPNHPYENNSLRNQLWHPSRWIKSSLVHIFPPPSKGAYLF